MICLWENVLQGLTDSRHYDKGVEIMKVINLDMRVAVADSKISYKAIAAQMGVTPEYLSRVMGRPLKGDMRARILAALAELTGRGGGGDGKSE